MWFIPLDTGKNKHLIKTPKSFIFLNSMPDNKSIFGTIKDPASQWSTLVKLDCAYGRVEKIMKIGPGWFGATISPDGKTVVFIRHETKNKIIVLDNFR